MNIVLCGMMGCGKTSVGRQLARLTGKKLVDTDEEIVSKYGGINAIFEKFGEERFRDLETEAIKTLSGMGNSIISLGGGSLGREENRIYAKNGGIGVYLKTDIDTLVLRLEGDNTRPLLRGGVREKLTSLMAVRGKIYENFADIIVQTDGKTVEEIAEEILKEAEKFS